VEGIEREILEETQLTATAVDIAGVYEYDFDQKGQPTHRFTVYSTDDPVGDVVLSEEHLEYRWSTKDEILELLVEPFLRDYFLE